MSDTHLHDFSVPLSPDEPHKRRCAGCREPQVYRAPIGKPQVLARTEGCVAAAPGLGEYAVMVLCDGPPTGRKFRAGEIVEVVSIEA